MVGFSFVPLLASGAAMITALLRSSRVVLPAGRAGMILLALLLVLAGSLAAADPVPGMINFQGRLKVAGATFSGSGSFKFALVSADGGTTYWSNDGSSLTGDEPVQAVTLPVVRGLYSVLLGDSGAGRVPIPAVVFANGDVRLRVWFDDGVHGLQRLTPDQRVAAVGYALRADSVSDGAVGSAALADGAVTDGKIATLSFAKLTGVPSPLPGPAGLDGATWRDGSGTPDDSVGKNGDYYLDGLSGTVYRRAADAYTAIAIMKGDTGPAGATGAPGPAGAAGPIGPIGVAGV